MTDYPDYQTPQAHASAIFATGVPLGVKSTLVDQVASGTSIGAGATVTRGPFTIGQIGSEIFFGVQAGAGATLPYVHVVVTWSDSASGNVVAIEAFWVFMGASANQNYGGPMISKGDTVQVAFTNIDTQPCTYGYSLLENSRVYARTDVRQITAVAVSGLTAPQVDQAGNILFNSAVSIAASSSINRYIPFYAGRMGLLIDNTAQANAVGVIINLTAQHNLTTGEAYSGQTAAGAVTQVDIDMPRASCSINISNKGSTGSITPLVSGIISEQAA